MATAFANTNVYPLPTAARRKVPNPHGFALLAARQSIPRIPTRWPVDHESGRKDHQEAAITRSPELMIVMAMMKVLAPEQKERVRGYIKSVVDFDYLAAGPHAATTLAIVEKIN